MEWISSISNVINYIEENLTDVITMEEVAKQAYTSAYYFQKGFAMLCGLTVGEYIKQRRLSEAGVDTFISAYADGYTKDRS